MSGLWPDFNFKRPYRFSALFRNVCIWAPSRFGKGYLVAILTDFYPFVLFDDEGLMDYQDYFQAMILANEKALVKPAARLDFGNFKLFSVYNPNGTLLFQGTKQQCRKFDNAMMFLISNLFNIYGRLIPIIE